MLSVITGNTPRQKTVVKSCSFNLVRVIRVRRLQWLGHILWLDEDRMLQRVVKDVYENRCEGDIMMDAPKTDSWRELKMCAVDRDKWRNWVQSVRWESGVQIKTKVFVPEMVVSFTISRWWVQSCWRSWWQSWVARASVSRSCVEKWKKQQHDHSITARHNDDCKDTHKERWSYGSYYMVEITLTLLGISIKFGVPVSSLYISDGLYIIFKGVSGNGNMLWHHMFLMWKVCFITLL